MEKLLTIRQLLTKTEGKEENEEEDRQFGTQRKKDNTDRWVV